MKTRLQRYLADCGLASRRECEAIIAAGRVRVNGQIRTDAPILIDPDHDIVTVDETQLTGAAPARELARQDLVYYLLNKPKGILVTNFDPSQRKTVSELLPGVAARVFPVGRLDMDSRGALLMTNDGELANRLTHPRYAIEKTYIVEVDGHLAPPDLEKIKRGLWLGPERRAGAALRTEGLKLKLIGRERGRTVLEVRTSEGRNSPIRRVMARLGHPVRDLNRVAIAGKLTTGHLPVGGYRPLTAEEVKWLYYASSLEYHQRQQTATQRWYEQKEMAKERRRLATAPAQPQPRPRPAAAGPAKFTKSSRPNQFAPVPRSKPPHHRPEPRASFPRSSHPLGRHARPEE